MAINCPECRGARGFSFTYPDPRPVNTEWGWAYAGAITCPKCGKRWEITMTEVDV